jgi:lysophospholipase L1-like esterase
MPRRLLLTLAVICAAVLAVVALIRMSPGSSDGDSTAAAGSPAAATRSLTGPVGRYVALGDSFTAGPLVPYVDAARPGCLRSTANYPAVVAAWLSVARFVDVSCSGAETADLQRPQQGFGPAARPQLQAVTAATALVTIGMGGNDFGLFGTLVGRCPALAESDPTGSPCRQAFTSADGTDTLLARLPQIEDRLVDALLAVRERAPDAVVAVVGYPRLVPVSGSCADLPLATEDYRWADRVQRGLNAALAAAAAAGGATYVDTYTGSTDHDVCAADPWVNGAATLPTEALAYHPNAAGMRATAQAVFRSLTDAGVTGRQRAQARLLSEQRPPGTLSLRQQRVIATLLGVR